MIRFKRDNLIIDEREEVTSTNDLLKELADDNASTDYLMIAKKQTSGHGRNGRTFVSPKGGIYFSFLLHPDIALEKVHYHTAAMAVAVAESIEELTGKQINLKWVNDVYLAGRKICGILTEGRFNNDGSLAYAIIGIGINIEEPEGGFPEDIKNLAGAIFENGKVPEGFAEKLMGLILEKFYGFYDKLEEKAYLEEYRRRNLVIGKEIRVITNTRRPDQFFVAKAEGIDDEFGLVIKKEDGSISTLTTGEITIRVD